MCRREDGGNFCLFSIKFSEASNEILGGSNDRHLYLYDLAAGKRTEKIYAHSDDINAVAFADESSNILISGSDDMLCKVWDRRAMTRPARPVGTMVGHLHGITHISPKGDGRYFISNSKDQSIKLWDMRKMSSPDATPPGIHSLDYRFSDAGPNGGKQRIAQDHSLMTYSGHVVQRTLIRAKFSPLYSTGQKYIYAGSADGVIRCILTFPLLLLLSKPSLKSLFLSLGYFDRVNRGRVEGPCLFLILFFHVELIRPNFFFLFFLARSYCSGRFLASLRANAPFCRGQSYIFPLFYNLELTCAGSLF